MGLCCLLQAVSLGPDKELLAGAMFVATPYEHAEASYKIAGLEPCRCPQQHGTVTPTGPGTNCLFCTGPNFDVILDRFSRISQLRPTPRTCAVRYVMPTTHGDRVLIGAWTPML